MSKGTRRPRGPRLCSAKRHSEIALLYAWRGGDWLLSAVTARGSVETGLFFFSSFFSFFWGFFKLVSSSQKDYSSECLCCWIPEARMRKLLALKDVAAVELETVEPKTSNIFIIIIIMIIIYSGYLLVQVDTVGLWERRPSSDSRVSASGLTRSLSG